jgi:hypothetical protein
MLDDLLEPGHLLSAEERPRLAAELWHQPIEPVSVEALDPGFDRTPVAAQPLRDHLGR